MGTNYYLHSEPCDKCGRADEAKHIGKSSGGWCFALHVYPDEGIRDLPDWEDRWKLGTIRNEYGEAVTPDEMLVVITARFGSKEWPARDPDRMDLNEEALHTSNYSERGPAGLLRARRDRKRVIGHGPGTWDLIVGDFS